MLELEIAFHDEMIELYKRARDDARYNATRFLGMINEQGGLETARTIVNSPSVSEGYTALWEKGRLDLTVEATILQPQWAPLFSDAERKIAVRRLREFGYKGKLPRF